MTTLHLDRPGGRIAFDDTGGDGRLVVAVPGMGDTRGTFRHLRPLLVDSGVRVVTMDLRGLGDSSSGWNEYSDGAVATDLVALVRHLDAGPAVVLGNSMGAGAAVIAATDAPDLVSGMVLIGPFVREVELKWWQTVGFKAMLAPPWGRAAWVRYFDRAMFPGGAPDDHAAYVEALGKNLKEPGRMAAFRRLAGAGHAESGRRLDSVTQPVVVVMGTADPDFPDPEGEARHVASVLDGELVLVEGSGHYPQAEHPERVAAAVLDLLSTIGA